MFASLDVFRMSSAMARHAGQRQAIAAQNVAQADTPGYGARDIPDFAALYDPGAGAAGLLATRVRHLHGAAGGMVLPEAQPLRGETAPNGNDVSIEAEMLRSVEAKRQHDRALAIYKTSINVLRGTLRAGN